jgi:hypothetical protein
MGYIIKDTSSLIVSRLTDYGRMQMSRGLFDVSYFQIGDSEVCYNCIPGADLSDGMVLEAEYNANNGSPIPQKNQANIKYPIFVDSTSGNTFGIPVNDSYIDNIYNTAAARGFFTSNPLTNNVYSAFTSSAYTIASNYEVDLSTVSSGNTLTLTPSIGSEVQEGQFITIYFNGGYSPIENSGPILTYKIVSISGDDIELDRQLPDFSSYSGNVPVLIYPSGMTVIYDTFSFTGYTTEELFLNSNSCYEDDSNVLIWNMNTPWTESPAGLDNNLYQGYEYFGSTGYTGTKEYLGYNSNSGQIDTDSTYYFNSLNDKIVVTPSNQKAISIIHYTNEALDSFYGEKFATNPRDTSISLSADTGSAMRFKISLPWVMWHKNTNGTIGQDFYIDPSGYTLLNPYYIQSDKSVYMANPGLRYYHLWDTNESIDGYTNRVGKVWPDLKLITIDDDELVAVLNGKSNRNWTLPAPRLSLVSPYTLDNSLSNSNGILSVDTQTMWVTYRLNNTGSTNSLHCNYYSSIVGPSTGCSSNSQNVILNFGNEFTFLQDSISSTPSGYSANEFTILAQVVSGNTRPNPKQWREIDVTYQLSATSVNGFITSSGITGTTLQITLNDYNNAPVYDLSDYIELVPNNSEGVTYNFGDDYYFYGNIETDIQATIYVMNYKCNLGQSQFQNSTNPTWTGGSPYVTEVGLYDTNKNLVVVSKIQSPTKRQGVQQYSIKLDF